MVLSLTALSQLAVGLLLYRRLESQLEADLARRLVHVSTLLGYSVDAALVVQFREGDEGLPAYQLVRRRLTAQAEAAGVSRAYVFDARSQTLVDTEDQRPGRVRHRLLAHRAELAQAFAGNAVATRLYADEEDRLRLSAFAPLRDRDRRVTAVVGVDAPPAFFAALAAVRREMALLGLAGIGLVALAGTLIVRQVGARLGRLREMVTGAKGGDPRPAGQPHGADQIGALGRDLEQLVGAMVASREYQAAVLGSVDVGLLTCGADDRVTLANARLHQLLALGDDALIGRAVQDLLAGEPALAVFARAAAHAEAPLRAELPLRGGPVAGGRLLAASASRLVEGGRPSGLVLSLLDVTELRQAERRARENERLAALGGMAGGLLHELGNPLAALTMYLDLLSPLTPAGKARELLDRAVREDARLREFLEDFRVFAGLAALRVETVELLQLAQLAAEPLVWPPEIVRAVRASGRARGDRRLLAHAVRNLLRNALEALPRGGCVRLALACEGGEARVVVSDDGPGLTSEQLEKILEPFHTTKPHGSGLGLLIARRVAELHGGRLEAGAAAGSGATFTLRWPLARPAAE